jgi:hypothetical protein
LKVIDPNWTAKNSALFNELFKIGNGKELRWATKFGPYGGGQDVGRFRDWMMDQAQKLENAASSIQAKRPHYLLALDLACERTDDRRNYPVTDPSLPS